MTRKSVFYVVLQLINIYLTFINMYFSLILIYIKKNHCGKNVDSRRYDCVSHGTLTHDEICIGNKFYNSKRKY